MSLAVCHSQCAATAASSQRAAASSSIRAPLRCFTAAVRGQQLVQQRAAVRAQRAAVVARATFAAEEEAEFEEVRSSGPPMRRLWQWGGGLLAGRALLPAPPAPPLMPALPPHCCL